MSLVERMRVSTRLQALVALTLLPALLGLTKSKSFAGQVRKYNPACSFPTIIINNGEKVLIGFSRKRFDEEFKNG